MKNRSRKAVLNAKRKPNPLRQDPTRSVTMRRAFAGKVGLMFMRLKGTILKQLIDGDALGLRPVRREVFNIFCATGEGGGVDPTCEKDVVKVAVVGGASVKVKQLTKGVTGELEGEVLEDLKIGKGLSYKKGEVIKFFSSEVIKEQKETPKRVSRSSEIDDNSDIGSWLMNWSLGQEAELTPDVIKSLAKYAPTKPVVLYRGVNATDVNLDKVKRPTSWTRSKETAAVFGRGEHMSPTPSEGRILKKVFQPSEILVDLNHPQVKAFLSNLGYHGEKEVVVKPNVDFREAKITKVGTTHNAFCATGPGGGVDPTCSTGSSGGGSGGGSGPSHEHKIEITPEKALSKAGKAGAWVKEQTAKIYKKLEARYGKKGAAAIFTSGQALSWGAFAAGAAMGQVIYIPSAAAMIPGAAIAEVARHFKGATANEEGGEVELTPEEIERLGKELIEEITKLWESRPVFDDDEPADNAFCPTGEGGGVDPTCSPGGSGVSSRIQAAKDAAAKIPFTEDRVVVKGRGPGGLPSLKVTYTLDTWGRDHSGDHALFFKTSADSRYKVIGQPHDSMGVKGLEIAFEDQRGSTDVTKAGNAHEVFSKVTAAAIALVDHERPEVVTLHGKGESRQRLYDRMVKATAAAHPDYSVAHVKDPDDPSLRLYVMAKRELMPKLMSKFPAELAPTMLVNEGIDPAWWTSEETWNAFCPTGEGGGIDPTCSPGEGGSTAASAKVGRVMSRFRAIPAAVASRIRTKVVEKYTSLETRYGSRYAKAIIGAALVGLPVPLPGASMALAAPVVALAELHRLVSGKGRAAVANEEDLAEMTDEEIAAAVAELVSDLQEEFGDLVGDVPTVNPFVSEDQRRACYAADDPDWDCEEWEEKTHNIFCPTGLGGGVDPTCGKGDAGAGGGSKLNAASIAIAEKYRGQQASGTAMQEFMEANGLTIEDYAAANQLMYRHNVASGGQVEKDIVEAWHSNSKTGQALRLSSKWQEWQLEHELRAPAEFDLESIKTRVGKMAFEDVKKYQEGGGVVKSKEEYIKLIEAQAKGEHVFYRKGSMDAQVISMTSDKRGARSGGSRFVPDRFKTYADMKAEGYHLLAGARGMVGVTSSQEQEYIWIKGTSIATNNELKARTDNEQIQSKGLEEKTGSRDLPKAVENCAAEQMRDATTGRCGPGIGVDIPRTEMPQIRGGDFLDFVAFASGKGVRVYEDQVPVDDLSPVQREFRQERVDSIPHAKALFEPIIVSQDDYVLDGTHRWVKVWQRNKGTKMQVARVDLPLREALDLMRSFPRAEFAANVFCATGEGGGVDPTCSPSGGAVGQSTDVGTRMNREQVIDHIMASNPPEMVSTGNMTKEEWASTYLSDEPDGYVVASVDPRVLNLPLGDTSKLIPEKVSEFSGRSAGGPLPVVDSNDKLQARYGGGKLEQAYGSQEHTVIDGKHRVASAVNRGDKAIKVIVPSRKLEKIKEASKSLELTDFAHKYAESKGHTIHSVQQGTRGPTVTAVTKDGNTRIWGPSDLEKIASKVGHTFVTHADDNWRFRSDPKKVEAFKKWLEQQIGAVLVGRSQQQLWDKYIQDGFKKGQGRAFDDATRSEKVIAAGKEKLDFYAGTRDQFLKSSFGRPVAVEKVQLLAGRTFDELKGITADMSLRMTRKLTDGLVQGKGPREVARDLNAEVDIGWTRALTVARTELIRAHAEGQLTALGDLGVEDVGVAVEWSTTGDDRVCEECQPLEGVVMKLDEARGMLPRHPNCRCAWIPANVGEDKEGQKATRGSITGAVRDSRKAGGDEDDESWGPAKEVDRSRPKSIFNELDRKMAAALNQGN